jgi:acyl-CoA reductase-like NAD-dependent aldehyde dehydrogenase
VIQLLKDALDNDIFAWTTERVKEDEIGVRCIYILQNGPHSQKHSHELVSQAQSRAIAVVERDANLDFAAKSLVTARFCLSGKSPYAPDLILVNESVKDSFVEAALQEAFRVLAQTTKEPENEHYREPIQDVLERIKRSGEAQIVASGANGAVLVVSERYDYDLVPGL